jgi:hypothetical protein
MNKVRSNSRNLFIFYIAALVLISTFFGFAANVGASEPISAHFNTDKMSDMIEINPETDDSELVLNIVIETDSAGKFTIFGDMGPSSINSQATITTYLNAGENTVELNFVGNNIYRSQVDGNYIILLTLEISNEEMDRINYRTLNAYDHNSFKGEGEDISDYSIGLVSNTVKLQTDVFTAVIYEYQPVIEYFYSIDDGNTARFKVTYTNLLGYSDGNGDNKYNPIDDEVIYTADLVNAKWNSNKVLFENFESFDFVITAAITLESTGNPDVDAVVSFHYSSASYTTNSQRKFDIDIQLMGGQPLVGVSALAIEQVLEDQSSSESHSFQFNSASNEVDFVSTDGLTHGYYSWLPSADTNNGQNDVPVEASIVESEAGMILYLSYSYDETIVWYYHDPLIGIDTDNIRAKLVEAAEEILHNPALYIASSVIASVVVFGSLRRHKRK